MPTKQPKGNILIVDDTLANLRLLTNMLTEQGHKVRGVPNGSRALKATHLAPPDLILLDIMMPEIDGYEVCKQLKTDEKTRDIPVIFISALDAVFDKVKAFSVGGVDYITKPFQVEEVLARINTHLTLRNMQKQLQEINTQLLKTNEALLSSNKELDAFAHTVAHDLNNPLSIILGYSEMLEHSDLTSTESEQYLQTITQTANKMSTIISELLLLAGVRKTKIEPELLDMTEIIIAAKQRLLNIIQESKVQIDLPDEWPEAIGYAPWIEEVWVNYISNGLKYGGRPPHLKLGATVQPNNMVKFWIQDNGPGLTEEEQSKLFVPFTRLTKLKVDGHGLGLSIVHRIIQKLNGQVAVESVIGAGSKFSFTLPCPPQK